jgi:hypothetical protein
MDQFDREGIVDLAAQIAHIDIDDIRHSLRNSDPRRARDHGSREDPTGGLDIRYSSSAYSLAVSSIVRDRCGVPVA